MSNAHVTTDHATIKDWAKTRGGKPAEVEGTGDEDPGVLRIEFPDYSGCEKLKRIQWPSFFKKFDEKDLALLYQETTDQGEISRFCKFVYAPTGVLEKLHEEHGQIRQLLEKMSDTTQNAVKTRPRMVEELEEKIVPHMVGEEKIFYKAMKKHATKEQMPTALEGYEEHRLARKALKRLKKADPDTPDWDARQKVLKEVVEHHIEEEESELFEMAWEQLGRDGLQEMEGEYLAREEKAMENLKS
ncbi:MAG: hemerythrin domain-containing protein [Phycisphaerae bacterium]